MRLSALTPTTEGEYDGVAAYVFRPLVGSEVGASYPRSIEILPSLGFETDGGRDI